MGEFVQKVTSFCESVLMWCSKWGIGNHSNVLVPNLEELHYYVIDEVITNCAFNKFYRCYQPDNGRMVFIKEIFVPEEHNENVLQSSMSNQMNFHRFFYHPNVLRVVDILSRGRYKYIVYEYFSVDLSYFISLPKVLRDPQIKVFLQQIVSAVEHYHSYEIIVGVIKPQFLQLNNTESSIKLAFGDPWASYPTKSSQYSAPELLFGSRRYSKAADMWSAGCIFGEMVIGQALFRGRTPNEQLTSIFRLLGTPTEESWPGVTTICTTLPYFPKYEPKNLAENFPGLEPEGIDLLSKMLCLNPEERISAEDVLKHEYFNSRESPRIHETWRIAQSKLRMLQAMDEMTSFSAPDRMCFSY